jgi:two-component system sensor histidine kinase SenX3
LVVRTRGERDRSRLAVVDFGAGVPEHEAERIFERFYRLDPQQREGVSGTGLGLHISRELVRQLGGDLWVERTEPGGGATFVVDLPRRS